MTLASPADFPRAFSSAWSARDVDRLAAMFAEDADFLSLTGAWAEGRAEVAEVLGGELAGAFSRARLVTGRAKLRDVGRDGAVLIQRFVLSGIRNEDGSDAGRVGTILSAVLAGGAAAGWQVVSASFTVEG